MTVLIVVGLLSGCAERGLTLERVKRDLAHKYPQVQTITVQEVHEMIRSGRMSVLLDVREPEEYAVSHLRGAQRAGTLAEALPLLPPGEVSVVVYCSVGYRSAGLAEALMGHGRTNVFNMSGSLFAWANAGLPLFRKDQRVKEVHPYNDRWGALLDKEYHPPREKRLNRKG